MEVKVEKTERAPKQNPNNAVKILNDEKIKPLAGNSIIVTSVPLPMSSPKQISICLAKPKAEKNLKQKKMDHYVMQTIKGEKNAEGEEEGDTINFILTENDEEEVPGPSMEVVEEVEISGEEEGPPEIVEHVCGKCFKTFRRLKGLRRHIDYCRFDSGYHLRKAEMLKNLEKIEKDSVIMENKDVCFCCGESYDTCHLGHINCPDCPKSFKTQMSYERHIFITHSEFNDHACSICNGKLRSANLLQLHEEQHRIRGKPYACKICGKDFTRSYHLSRHQKFSSCSVVESDTMHCKVCNKAFYRLDNLRAHLKQHLGTHSAKKAEYMCPICKKCFYSLSTLNIHTRTHTGERPFDCDLCEKKFPSLMALKKHRRYHTGEKPYTCSVCKQSFAVKEVLNRHMKRHTGEKPHVCSECGKSFIQKTQLRIHARTHLRPFECELCPEKFRTEPQLKKHFKSVHSVKTRRGRSAGPKCNICKISFKTELEHTKHMKENKHMTPKEKRKLKNRTDCSVCKENFDCVQSLQFHILKVHQEDPETFYNVDPFGKETQQLDETSNSSSCEKSLPAPKIIKIEDSKGQQHIEFVTTNGEGKILNSSIEELTNIELIRPPSPKLRSKNKVEILEEFIIEELPSTSNRTPKDTVILSNESYTVIPLESDGGIIETVTTKSLPEAVATSVSSANKKEQRKNLAESLAAAIADDDDLTHFEADGMDVKELNEDEVKLKENISKLLDMLVDVQTLKKFGWPELTEETVLCKVIENCGHDLSQEQHNFQEWEYGSRMREYVKLLFTVVIHNDSIKELLNNYPIDEVIEYVLGNDDDEDDVEEIEDKNKIKNEETTSDGKYLDQTIKCEEDMS